MKISDGFKFEIGQFIGRLAISAAIITLLAFCFLVAAFVKHFIG
jgi:hypothetical protein